MNAVAGDVIRFGVLLDGDFIERWQAACMERLLALPSAHAALVIVCRYERKRDGTSAADSSGPWLFRRLVQHRSRSFWRQRCALPSILTGANAIRVELLQGTELADLSSSAAAAIGDRRLDFILNFCSAHVADWLLESARFGTWAFLWGDRLRDRGKAATFWDSYDGASTAEASLVRLTADEREVIVLRAGSLRVADKSYDYICEQLCSRFTHWPAQVCIDIRNGSSSFLDGAAVRLAAGVRDMPGNLAALIYAGKGVWRKARSYATDLFRHDQWNVGVVKRPIATMLHANGARDVEWLPMPGRSEFLADCFGVLRGDRIVLLCEHLDQNDGRGTIIAVEPGTDAARVRVEIGPSPPVHLSYPFLLEHEGKVLCIPESHEAAEVGLYEAEDFPRRWRKVATLLSDVALVDATVFHHNGYWWLAGSEVAAKGANCELHLWYARDLMGPWQPHAQNPVKTDVRSARPGGTPFVHQGTLYRPAQDCSRTYGGRIVINRVLRLSPTSFSEDIAATVDPDPDGPYPAGLHTLSAVGPFTVLDAKRRIFVPQEFLRVLRWAVFGASRGKS